MTDLVEILAPLWCQHCKAMQKVKGIDVECWYSPLTEAGRHAWCESCLDAIGSLLSRLSEAGVVRLVSNQPGDIYADQSVRLHDGYYHVQPLVEKEKGE